MRAYNFSMERVLEWREDLERDSMEKFAAKQNELQKEKSVLMGIKSEYENLKKGATEFNKTNDIRNMHLYKQVLLDKMDQQNLVVNEKSKELEERRVELVDAQKDRKIMEKLKEKDYMNYQNEVRVFEQKQLDEMAVLKFKRA